MANKRIRTRSEFYETTPQRNKKKSAISSGHDFIKVYVLRPSIITWVRQGIPKHLEVANHGPRHPCVQCVSPSLGEMSAEKGKDVRAKWQKSVVCSFVGKPT